MWAGRGVGCWRENMLAARGWQLLLLLLGVSLDSLAVAVKAAAGAGCVSVEYACSIMGGGGLVGRAPTVW